MLISIIIPSYNEEVVIAESYRRLSEVLEKVDNYSYELIFVNDGSVDKTFDILCDIAQKDHKVKVLNFSRNFGHQAAVTAGLKHCNGDLAVIIDADLQDPPEVIPQMIEVYEKENYLPDTDKWDGSGLPDGTYYYVLTYEGYIRSGEHKGSLTILR